jgi:hypothetical protein
MSLFFFCFQLFDLFIQRVTVKAFKPTKWMPYFGFSVVGFLLTVLLVVEFEEVILKNLLGQSIY